LQATFEQMVVRSAVAGAGDVRRHLQGGLHAAKLLGISTLLFGLAAVVRKRI
jgi:hypothetical protein